MSATVLTVADVAKLAELQQLLDEAYDHYFDHSDGYSKSGEGLVQLHLGDYDERQGGLASVHVKIYSLLVHPSRRWFDTIDEALAAVREWHEAEMHDDHPDPFAEWVAEDALLDETAAVDATETSDDPDGDVDTDIDVVPDEDSDDGDF